MSTINVDIVDPQSGNNVTVSGVVIDSPTTNSIAVGINALQLITTGTQNIAIGTDTLKTITGANRNIAIGFEALSSLTSGNSNTAIGTYALNNAVTGGGNVAIGYNASSQLNGGFNTSTGYEALVSLVTGGNNTAIGGRAGYLLSTGNGNVFLGPQAGWALTTGNDNIIIGFGNPGGPGQPELNSGNNNIMIGNNTLPSTPVADNEITLGNLSNTVLRCAVTSITSLSDSRDKEEVAELAVGLDFVKELNPVSFVWNDRDESGKHGVKDFGFIAQDLKATQEKYDMAETLGLVYEENPEKLEASYGKLIPILVKAIQDLSAKVEALESKKKK